MGGGLRRPQHTGCSALQVERFACLYTSHVSNMALYSPDKAYKAREDHMAHEDVALHPPPASLDSTLSK
jgi:hypothetical protein